MAAESGRDYGLSKCLFKQNICPTEGWRVDACVHRINTAGAAAHLDEKCRLVEEPWRRTEKEEPGHAARMRQLH